MKYVEAPTTWNGQDPSVFLAGGISNCPQWQAAMVDLLCDTDLTVLNPRRADFPIGDPSAAEAQITWEYWHLRRAGVISFWFSAATLCPIVLYELGAWSRSSKPIAVGIEPGYEREQDVRIQTRLVRSEVKIVDSLEYLAGAVVELSGCREGGYE